MQPDSTKKTNTSLHLIIAIAVLVLLMVVLVAGMVLYRRMTSYIISFLHKFDYIPLGNSQSHVQSGERWLFVLIRDPYSDVKKKFRYNLMQIDANYFYLVYYIHFTVIIILNTSTNTFIV